jgi:LuxR family maltose regulon positive regulatory protein
MYTGIGEVHYERDELNRARAALAESLKLGEELGFPRYPCRVRVLQARILQAEGDIDGAVIAFDEAERRYLPDYQPNLKPVAAQRAALQVAHGRLDEARRWASAAGLVPNEPVSYLREYELLTLARLLVAEARMEPVKADIAHAVDLLDRLLRAAQAGDREGSVLGILVVQAIARHAAGDHDGALGSLDRAARIASSGGYVRTFLDEGPAMTTLLRVAGKRAHAPGYVTALLKTTTSGRDAPTTTQSLVEPLSDRELEVLRLLRSELSGPDMARELVVSLNTLRTHTKNIYAKLGVTNRRSALRRAEELHLL